MKFEINGDRALQSKIEGNFDSITAVYELVDNALDAGATEFHIKTNQGEDTEYIAFCDDGPGIQNFVAAMEYAGNRERADDEVSHFGTGMKDSAFALGNSFWLISKADATKDPCGVYVSRKLIRDKGEYLGPTEVDQDEVARLWDNFSLNPAETGTVILVQELTPVVPKKCKDFIGNETKGIRNNNKLALRYCKALKTGRMKIYTRNGRGAPAQITYYDPLRMDDTDVQILCDQTVLHPKSGAKLDLVLTETPDAKASQFGVWVEVNGVLLCVDRTSIYGMYKNESPSHERHISMRGKFVFNSIEEFKKLFTFSSQKHKASVKEEFKESFGDFLRHSRFKREWDAVSARRKDEIAQEKRHKAMQSKDEADKKFADLLADKHSLTGLGLRPYVGKIKDFKAGKFGATESDMMSKIDLATGVVMYNESHISVYRDLVLHSDVKVNHYMRCMITAHAIAEDIKEKTGTEISYLEMSKIILKLVSSK